jgi:hypothetical protein
MSKCAFCGHPDRRHRDVDAINERVAVGEDMQTVLADYGWTRADLERITQEVTAALTKMATGPGSA